MVSCRACELEAVVAAQPGAGELQKAAERSSAEERAPQPEQPGPPRGLVAELCLLNRRPVPHQATHPNSPFAQWRLANRWQFLRPRLPDFLPYHENSLP